MLVFRLPEGALVGLALDLRVPAPFTRGVKRKQRRRRGGASRAALLFACFTLRAHAAGRPAAATEAAGARQEVAELVLAISGVVFWGFISWLLVRAAGRIARRTAARIEASEAIGAVQFHQVELLPVAVTRELARLSVFGALWVTRLGLGYLWLLGALSLFPAGRPYAATLTAYLFAPVLHLFAQLAARLPSLIALLVALMVVLLVLRFVTLYSRAVERGELESSWVRPERARTTGTLLAVGVALSALLFLPPILSGTADGSLPRMGLLGLGALALGATPVLASCVLGIRVVYTQSWKLGDLVEYGGERGRVEQLGLFDLSLRREDEAQVRVPHLMSLWHPTRILERARTRPVGSHESRPESPEFLSQSSESDRDAS